MAITSLDKTVFSAKTKEIFFNAASYAKMVNYDWESEAKLEKGAIVDIEAISGVTHASYDGATPITFPALTSNGLSLVIDTADVISFSVDDTKLAKTKIDLYAEGSNLAGHAMSDLLEGYIAAEYANVQSGNTIGTTGAPIDLSSSVFLYDQLVAAATLLNKQNVPLTDRSIVLPPDIFASLLTDTRFIANPAYNAGTLETALVGKAAGFNIYQSNLVPETAPSSGIFKVMAAHKSAITMAMSINEIETVRIQNLFSTGFKMLVVSGVKTVHPEAMVVITIKA